MSSSVIGSIRSATGGRATTPLLLPSARRRAARRARVARAPAARDRPRRRQPAARRRAAAAPPAGRSRAAARARAASGAARPSRSTATRSTAPVCALAAPIRPGRRLALADDRRRLAGLDRDPIPRAGRAATGPRRRAPPASSASEVGMPTIGPPSSWASVFAVARPDAQPGERAGPVPDDDPREVREPEAEALDERARRPAAAPASGGSGPRTPRGRGRARRASPAATTTVFVAVSSARSQRRVSLTCRRRRLRPAAWRARRRGSGGGSVRAPRAGAAAARRRRRRSGRRGAPPGSVVAEPIRPLDEHDAGRPGDRRAARRRAPRSPSRAGTGRCGRAAAAPRTRPSARSSAS